jgi:DNA-binding NarL/FixJ family response regulator
VNAALQANTANTELEPRPVMTPRERDVLALLGEGLSNRDIADRIAISVTTVKTHVARLMERTGATNRVQLALLAVRHNITR